MIKLTLGKTELKAALEHVAGVAENRAKNPVLGSILLKAGGETPNEVTLTATDLDVSLAVVVDGAVVKEGGSICVPVSTFPAMVKVLTDDEVFIEEQANNRLKLYTENSSFKMACLPASDFPSWPEMEDPVEISIAGHALKALLLRTHYAAGKDTKACVLLEPNGDVLTLVATDGHMLAVAEGELLDKAAHGQHKMPLKAAREALRFLNNSDEPAVLSLSKSMIGFRVPGAEMVGRVVAGEVVDYQTLFKEDVPISFSLRRADITAALHRVAVISPYVNIEGTGAGLTVFAKSDLGEVKDKVKVENYKGGDFKVKLKVPHLLAALGPMSEENISIELTDGSSPVLIRENDDHRCMLAPLKG